MGGWVWVPTVSGPLAGHATGFERWLRTGGFSGSAVSQRIWQFDHLSRWLDREGLRLDQLTPARQEQFLAARRAAGYRTWVSARSLRCRLRICVRSCRYRCRCRTGRLSGCLRTTAGT